MRELGWPVPVFCARTEGGWGRTEKHAVFPLRVYSMFFQTSATSEGAKC